MANYSSDDHDDLYDWVYNNDSNADPFKDLKDLSSHRTPVKPVGSISVGPEREDIEPASHLSSDKRRLSKASLNSEDHDSLHRVKRYRTTPLRIHPNQTTEADIRKSAQSKRPVHPAKRRHKQPLEARLYTEFEAQVNQVQDDLMDISVVSPTPTIPGPTLPGPLQRQQWLLWQDVSGEVPEEQFEVRDSEMQDHYVFAEDWVKETEHAKTLCMSNISNAPRVAMELPWDELEDITLLELIVYFPNHVTRWPVLALMLRASGWDKLFTRVALLINRSRMARYSQRPYLHAEPLQCMMKAELGIKELEPTYRMAEHDTKWKHVISRDWMIMNRKRRPQRLKNQDLEVISVEDAAGWVLYTGDIAHCQFTRRLAQQGFIELDHQPYDITYTQWFNRPPPVSHRPASASAPRQSSTSSRRDAGNGEETDTGYQADDEPNSPFGPAPGQRTCKFGRKCKRKGQGCKFGHPEDELRPRAHPASPPTTFQSSNPDCLQGLTCTNPSCKFAHPAEPQYASDRMEEEDEDLYRAGVASSPEPVIPSKTRGQKRATGPPLPKVRDFTTPKEPSGNPARGERSSQPGICKFDKECTRTTCIFAHHGPVTPPYITLDPNEKCNEDRRCKNKRCNKSHSSPTATNKPSQAESSPHNTSKGLCRKDGACTNKDCKFTHSGPKKSKTKEDTQANTAEVCKFGSKCRNENCKRNHLSSTPAPGGKASQGVPRGGGGRGRGRGWGGRGGGGR
jgi:hypothetical protein